MSRRTPRLVSVAAAAGATAVLAVATAPLASAVVSRTDSLAPGQSSCVSQYASYQVRGEGWATNGGARFKLLRNGQVVQATGGRVTSAALEARTSYGTFPGAGTYSFCAYNTGTSYPVATITIRTDSEL